jgi:hypothetical protein
MTVAMIEDTREALRRGRGAGVLASPSPGTAGAYLLRVPGMLCERDPGTGRDARLRDRYHGQATYEAKRGESARAPRLRVCSSCAIALREIGWRLQHLVRSNNGGGVGGAS